MRAITVICGIGLLILIIIPRAEAQGALGPGFYDDRDYFLTYSGTGWTDLTWPVEIPSVNNTRTTSSVQGDSFSFSMWGDGFYIYTLRGTARPDLQVCVNSICNIYIQTLSGYGVIEFSGFGYGTHDVDVYLHDTSGGAAFDLDGVMVLPPAPQPTLEPQEIIVQVTVSAADADTTRQTFQVTNLDGTESQDVAFSYSASVGDVAIVLVMSAIALPVLFATGSRWLGRGNA